MLDDTYHVECEVDLGLADLDINLELALTLGLRFLETHLGLGERLREWVLLELLLELRDTLGDTD